MKIAYKVPSTDQRHKEYILNPNTLLTVLMDVDSWWSDLPLGMQCVMPRHRRWRLPAYGTRHPTSTVYCWSGVRGLAAERRREQHDGANGPDCMGDNDSILSSSCDR